MATDSNEGKLRELQEKWPGITHPKKLLFLDAYSKRPVVIDACKAAGITYATVYSWRGRVKGNEGMHDPTFEQHYETAHYMGGEALVQVAYDWATANDIDKRSEKLLLEMLKAWRRNEFTPHQKIEVDAVRVKVIERGSEAEAED